jgi:cyclopropane fatty-acyl-phospholipid synthase-like methyltransferase
MLISETKGTKFPDPYIVQFFYKEGLDKTTGKVLELGSGNGHNLMLFYQYNWKTLGLDMDIKQLENGEKNFLKMELEPFFQHIRQEGNAFVGGYSGTPFEAVLVSNALTYLPNDKIDSLFNSMNRVIDKGSFLFIRTRTPDDYRFAKGEKLSENSYILDIKETGEEGRINTFFSEPELNSLLDSRFDFSYKYFLNNKYDTLQDNIIISNSDIIFWGKVKRVKKND